MNDDVGISQGGIRMAEGLSGAILFLRVSDTEAMKPISFMLYYFKLHLSIMLGLYHTSYPLDISWRWRFWLDRNRAQRGH